MGNFIGRPTNDEGNTVDQELNTPAEQLNEPETPINQSTEMRAGSPELSLDAFQDELGKKMTDLQTQKAAWTEVLKEVMGNFRSGSPFLHEAMNEFPQYAEVTDYTKTMIDWFKNNILSAITLEIEPANFALDQLIAQFEAALAPLTKDLQEAEEQLHGWNAKPEEGKLIGPVFQGKICNYAIQILNIEIAMLEAIKAHIAHCIGCENASVGILTLIMKSLNLSIVNLVLPNIDFSSAYQTFLNAEITPEETIIESLVAENDGLLEKAKKEVTPAKLVSPKQAASPEQTIQLDDSAKSALLSTSGQFARRKPSGVIAPKPKYAQQAQHVPRLSQ